MSGQLTFLHLSDIHFSWLDGRPIWDLNAEQRREAERDFGDLARDLGAFDGVLISGDIAFSGQGEEYAKASEWLDTVTRMVGCSEERVWLVPGNHDVDRTTIRRSEGLKDLHLALRTCNEGEIDNKLRNYLDEPVTGDHLFSPLAEYSRFASKYRCDVSRKEPHWEHRFPLGAGVTLVIRGLSTVVASDDHDDDGANKLVLGTASAMLLREPGVVYMTMAHHPLSWLRQSAEIENRLRSAHLRLWGHRHIHDVQRIGDTVDVFAGALQPERDLDWHPHFSAIRLSTDEGSTLRVEVWPRKWYEAERKFGPDYLAGGEPTRSYELPFESGPPSEAPLPRIVPVTPSSEPIAPARFVDPGRRLAYRFISLPYVVRLATLRELGVLEEPGDLDLPESALFTQALNRARERGLLAKLWESVEAGHGEPAGPNPFAGAADQEVVTS